MRACCWRQQRGCKASGRAKQGEQQREGCCTSAAAVGLHSPLVSLPAAREGALRGRCGLRRSELRTDRLTKRDCSLAIVFERVQSGRCLNAVQLRASQLHKKQSQNGVPPRNLENGVPVSALDCRQCLLAAWVYPRFLAQSCSEMACSVGPEWMPESSSSLQAVASVDPRPDTVEDVLNVCPQQAASFGELL